MIDREQAAIMARDIERYLADLEQMGISSKKDLEGKERYYAVSMVLFSIINRAIDLGNLIITGTESMGIPPAYKELFETLGKKGVIGKNVAVAMTKIVKYRNAIAHDYYEMDATEIYALKNNIYVVRKFTEEIKAYLKTQATE